MARFKDEKKRVAIRNAVVDEVLHSGLAGASVARIAKRASVSAGTIYLYFPNKEVLLQQIYLEIKAEFHRAMMSDVTASANHDENIRRMWFCLLSWLQQHPNDFLFSEFINAAQLLDSAGQAEINTMADDVSHLLQAAIDDGTLAKVPLPAIKAVLIAPMLHLARQAAIMKRDVDQSTLETTFSLVWEAVRGRA